MFGWLPIETLIRERQQDYYDILGICDKAADSGKFVDFMLTIIYDALKEAAESEQEDEQVSEQVKKLLSMMKDTAYTTKELMELVGLKHRATFRNNYLLPAIKAGYIVMTVPQSPNSKNQKYKRMK